MAFYLQTVASHSQYQRAAYQLDNHFVIKNEQLNKMQTQISSNQSEISANKYARRVCYHFF